MFLKTKKMTVGNQLKTLMFRKGLSIKLGSLQSIKKKSQKLKQFRIRRI